ncbi:hypothetical protein DLAC_08273 [Tieghemostelium lacteum]|uniref:KATNIP domain-containing protein n=1 Tax=Tieghemostelium lacteum TaxID=361077 RepID=A0A151ZBJ9_TIELA|nr:hypothetical protein DLAC_08273 [Tieghemostelium lacteum]|eukprot:KYQ91327.1 hypothetical protein DLAC_08273 [Tieghemostelium lacteum]
MYNRRNNNWRLDHHNQDDEQQKKPLISPRGISSSIAQDLNDTMILDINVHNKNLNIINEFSNDLQNQQNQQPQPPISQPNIVQMKTPSPRNSSPRSNSSSPRSSSPRSIKEQNGNGNTKDQPPLVSPRSLNLKGLKSYYQHHQQSYRDDDEDQEDDYEDEENEEEEEEEEEEVKTEDEDIESSDDKTSTTEEEEEEEEREFSYSTGEEEFSSTTTSTSSSELEQSLKNANSPSTKPPITSAVVVDKKKIFSLPLQNIQAPPTTFRAPPQQSFRHDQTNHLISPRRIHSTSNIHSFAPGWQNKSMELIHSDIKKKTIKDYSDTPQEQDDSVQLGSSSEFDDLKSKKLILQLKNYEIMQQQQQQQHHHHQQPPSHNAQVLKPSTKQLSSLDEDIIYTNNNNNSGSNSINISNSPSKIKNSINSNISSSNPSSSSSSTAPTKYKTVKQPLTRVLSAPTIRFNSSPTPPSQQSPSSSSPTQLSGGSGGFTPTHVRNTSRGKLPHKPSFLDIESLKQSSVKPSMVPAGVVGTSSPPLSPISTSPSNEIMHKVLNIASDPLKQKKLIELLNQFEIDSPNSSPINLNTPAIPSSLHLNLQSLSSSPSTKIISPTISPSPSPRDHYTNSHQPQHQPQQPQQIEEKKRPSAIRKRSEPILNLTPRTKEMLSNSQSNSSSITHNSTSGTKPTRTIIISPGNAMEPLNPQSSSPVLNLSSSSSNSNSTSPSSSSLNLSPSAGKSKFTLNLDSVKTPSSPLSSSTSVTSRLPIRKLSGNGVTKTISNIPLPNSSSPASILISPRKIYNSSEIIQQQYQSNIIDNHHNSSSSSSNSSNSSNNNNNNQHTPLIHHLVPNLNLQTSNKMALSKQQQESQPNQPLSPHSHLHTFDVDSIVNIKSSQQLHMTANPHGKTLLISIFSTWGDSYFVGLSGIDLFDNQGRYIRLKDTKSQIKAQPSDINDLSNYTNDPRTVDKIMDDNPRTCDDMHLWLAPFTHGQVNTITIQLDQPTTLSLIRIWNYNKSRIHSYRGAKDIEIKLDGHVIFKGSIKKAPGSLQGCEDSAEYIVLTDQEDILTLIETNDPFNSIIQCDQTDVLPEELIVKNRPTTSDNSKSPEDESNTTYLKRETQNHLNEYYSNLSKVDGRPLTSAVYRNTNTSNSDKQQQQTVINNNNQSPQIDLPMDPNFYPKGRKLKFTFLSTWGDKFYLGLTSFQIFDCNYKLIPIQVKDITASPKDINVVPGHSGDYRTLDKLIDSVNVTTNDQHMWLIPFQSPENNSGTNQSNNSNNSGYYHHVGEHYLTVEFPTIQSISCIRVWNYNKGQEDTCRGAKKVAITLDSQNLSPFTGYHIFRKSPGHSNFDFGQTISFYNWDKPLSPGKEISINNNNNNNININNINSNSIVNNNITVTNKQNEYNSLDLPSGFVIKFVILSTLGDTNYVGLNGLEIYDHNGNLIKPNKNNILSIPTSSIAKLSTEFSSDSRTIDKLFDGINNTFNDQHMWLAPFYPPLGCQPSQQPHPSTLFNQHPNHQLKVNNPLSWNDKPMGTISNTIYIYFDKPITIGMIKIWNYSKTINRGVEEFEIYLDDYIIYKGKLLASPSIYDLKQKSIQFLDGDDLPNNIDFSQSILFQK